MSAYINLFISRITCLVSFLLLIFLCCRLFSIESSPAGEKRYLKSQFDKSLSSEKPEIVLVGNSMLQEGVSSGKLSRLLKKKVIMIAENGAASAWWYLAMKNIIAKAPKKPKYVVVFFRDTFLTQPAYRVTGKYREALDAISSSHEPKLEQLAYYHDRYLQLLLSRLIDIDLLRVKFKYLLDGIIKEGIVATIFEVEKENIEDAIEVVFSREKLYQKEENIQQLRAEKITGHGEFDFDCKVDKSFLPPMISIARDSDINLIFVRIKRRICTSSEYKDSVKLENYIRSLESYLSQASIPLVDFTYEKSIGAEHFAAGDHLTRKKGQLVFTRLLAERLKPIVH